MASQKLLFIGMIAILVTSVVCSASDKADDNAKADDIDVDEEKVEYAKGSVCQYCTYCEFCVLCDEQCPCETGPGRPACHMCKYCSYCKFCRVCDTICQPGGILDKVTGALISGLPTFSKPDVDSDIAGVQTHITKKREEL